MVSFSETEQLILNANYDTLTDSQKLLRVKLLARKRQQTRRQKLSATNNNNNNTNDANNNNNNNDDNDNNDDVPDVAAKKIRNKIYQQNFRNRLKKERGDTLAEKLVNSSLRTKFNKQLKELKSQLSDQRRISNTLNLAANPPGKKIPATVITLEQAIKMLETRTQKKNNRTIAIAKSTINNDIAEISKYSKYFPHCKGNIWECINDKKTTNELLQTKIVTTSTRLNFLRAMYAMFSVLRERYNNIDEDWVRKLKNYQDILKARYERKSIAKITDPNYAVPTMKDYLNKVKEKAGENSNVYLYCRLYSEFPIRNDFQKMILNPPARKDNEVNEDLETQNYCLIQGNNVTMVVNIFKTKGMYEKLTYNRFKPDTVRLLKNFVRKYDIKDDTKLFKQQINATIKKMNDSLLIANQTPINLFRHIVISEFLKTKPKEEEKLQLTKKMGHSLAEQRKYERIIDPNYFDDIEKRKRILQIVTREEEYEPFDLNNLENEIRQLPEQNTDDDNDDNDEETTNNENSNTSEIPEKKQKETSKTNKNAKNPNNSEIPKKKKLGRPKKIPENEIVEETNNQNPDSSKIPETKRGRGRPPNPKPSENS
jgi:hypothetical protein